MTVDHYRCEVAADALDAADDEALWRATFDRDHGIAAGWVSTGEQIAHWARDRREVESRCALEAVAERAVVRDGWRTIDGGN
jgi:hypothetical protein